MKERDSMSENVKAKMKALVQYAPFDNRYETVDVPDIGPEEILLKVRGCGICAGDIKAYHGGIRIWGSGPKDRYIEAPVIGGHEFYGEILRTGEDVAQWKAGDVVCAEQIVPCGECDYCRRGIYWMCQKSAVYGFKQHAAGGFAQYMKLHKNSIVHRIPAEFTPQQSVLIEPIACGMHAVDLAEIGHEDVVVVAGLGAIGLSMVNMAKLRLPAKVIGLDVKDSRVAKGLEFGADVTMNPSKEDVTKRILALTEGRGCDVYIEASGSGVSVSQGLSLLRNHGRYVQMGVFADKVSADWNVIGDGKELTIKGSHLSARTFPAVIEGIRAGWIKTEGLVSHSFPLEQWEKAFETAQEDDTALKVMLTP